MNHKSTLQKNASIKASVTQWDTKSNLETLVNSWEDFQLDSSSCAPSQITVKLLSPLQQAYSTYLFRYVAWQPVKTFIQTFSWGGTGALNVPVRNSHINQFNLVANTCDIRIYKFISTENFSIVTIYVNLKSIEGWPDSKGRKTSQEEQRIKTKTQKQFHQQQKSDACSERSDEIPSLVQVDPKNPLKTTS